MATTNAWAWLFLLCMATSCHQPKTPQQTALISSQPSIPSKPGAAVKIAPPLRAVLQPQRESDETPDDATASPTHPLVRVDESGRVHTAIIVTHVDDDIVSALRTAHVQVDQISAKQQTIQGWIPVNRVEAVAALPFVRHLRLPSYAIRR